MTNKCYGRSFPDAKRKRRMSNLNWGWSGLWPGKAFRKKWYLSRDIKNKHEVDKRSRRQKVTTSGFLRYGPAGSKRRWGESKQREGGNAVVSEVWEGSYSSSSLLSLFFLARPSLITHVLNPFCSHFSLLLYACCGDKVFSFNMYPFSLCSWKICTVSHVFLLISIRLFWYIIIYLY